MLVSRRNRGVGRGAAVALGFLTLAAFAPSAAAQEYFGRNKVQFDNFEFEILPTDHFDVYFYGEEREAVRDASRMAERWYERFARAFQHEFEAKKPLIFYADHPDFQQTNTLSGFIGEGTGGVTESLKNRVIMPLAGSYWDTDHVLGHEIVHAFQYNIAQSRRGTTGMRGLSALPLWLVEGMAEYLSVGRDDPLTAMWIRDAIRRDDLPTIEQMTKESRFFPYRFGQGLWAYIGGTYGDDAVIQVFRRALSIGFHNALPQVLGIDAEDLSEQWKQRVALEYMPLMAGREAPGDHGRVLLAPSTGSGTTNISPSISPDGRYVAFLSEKDLFSVDLYLADVETGRIMHKLSSAASNPHVDALRYIDSSGSWSPDSKLFAFVVTAAGRNELSIVRASDGRPEGNYAFDDLGAIANPAWSPDGSRIAFTGTKGGITDLYVYHLEEDRLVQLTDDKFADLQPAWSPDGSRIAFASDRGSETNFDRLTFSSFQLNEIDVSTGRVSHLPIFGNVKHINPVYAADGASLFFISDQDGFSDIYRIHLSSGELQRVTNTMTGVSGHTYLAPAMSVSATDQIAYTLFNELEFHVYTAPVTGQEPVVTVVERPQDQLGRRLVPSEPDRFSRVATYLTDAETGLIPAATFEAEPEAYHSGLSLDYVGQPTLGVGTDNFGNYVGGGASAYFSDMLGNRVLGVAAQAQGSFKDIGGQLFYSDLSRRWNWAALVGHQPILYPFWSYGQEQNGEYYTALQKYRIYVSQAVGQMSYPFSSSQRLEFSAGPVRYDYNIEVDKYYQNAFGQVYDFRRIELDAPDPLTMIRASGAFVGDDAFFGFVSPIRGGRYRLQYEQTTGQVNFSTVIGDWRRYFAPDRNLTVGVRLLHYGRYGLTADEQTEDQFGLLRPLFLGYETFTRGYSYGSFSGSECFADQPGVGDTGACPVFDRLWGQQIAVGSLELRVPLVGVEQYGIINFPFVPTELVLFADAGAAWNQGSTCTVDDCDDLVLAWDRTGNRRVPVLSTGVSARMNVLGFMILETYFAYPWQRPEKGWHWGFQMAPGW